MCGAAFFNALAIDSLDCHDGFRPTKGHAGATVIPVVLAAWSERRRRGIRCQTQSEAEELLTCVALGYELALRAGMAVHELYAPAYHASGSWASLGGAAAAARLLQVGAEDLDFVVGCAEYQAPMSNMIRCTDNPGAVKDGAGAGALAATLALGMHDADLCGLPSIFVAAKEGQTQVEFFGSEWLMLRQYFKPYPVCRWTQPIVEGAVLLQSTHGFEIDEIERIQVETFDHAANSSVRFPPRHSDDAQYSAPWAVAARLADGKLGVDQVHPNKLSDPKILELGRRVHFSVAPDLEIRFPQECLARVTIHLKDGQSYSSPTIGARGDHHNPLSNDELESKFDALVIPSLGEECASRLKRAIDALFSPSSDSTDEVMRILTETRRMRS